MFINLWGKKPEIDKDSNTVNNKSDREGAIKGNKTKLDDKDKTKLSSKSETEVIKEKDRNTVNNKNDKDRNLNMAATMVESPPPQLITTIEWSMMDKSKFFPLYTLSSFSSK